MNIFYLDSDPIQAAKWQCDKHIIKMPLETAQMLCTAHRCLDGFRRLKFTPKGRKVTHFEMFNKFHDALFYKATHWNHPSTQWIMESDEHYRWAYEHWIALSQEFAQRQGKAHKSWEVLADYLLAPPSNIASAGFSEPPTAINEEWQHLIVPDDTVQSYRNYYQVAKRHLHKWKQNQPPWLELLEV